jgi:Holliday junction resolvasome RuvABC DNA-binding subunit
MQPRRLFINEGGTGRVLFQIAPDSHLEGSARAPKSFDEALLALQALGFQRNIAEKTLLKITNNNKLELSVEYLIKQSLKQL